MWEVLPEARMSTVIQLRFTVTFAHLRPFSLLSFDFKCLPMLKGCQRVVVLQRHL